MITVFANSTLYTPMTDQNTTGGGQSCLDLLRKHHAPIDGLWANGLTVLHVLPKMNLFLKERHRKHIVIINLGVVEAFTHPAPNVLHWCSHFLLENGCTPHFQTYTVPMMVNASHDLIHNKKAFYNLVESVDFAAMLFQILWLLEGFSIFLIGLNKPNMTNSFVADRWKEQAAQYDLIINKLRPSFNNISYFDIWNDLQEHVVDTTHLTPKGHQLFFKLINDEIERTYVKYNY